MWQIAVGSGPSVAFTFAVAGPPQARCQFFDGPRRREAAAALGHTRLKEVLVAVIVLVPVRVGVWAVSGIVHIGHATFVEGGPVRRSLQNLLAFVGVGDVISFGPLIARSVTAAIPSAFIAAEGVRLRVSRRND
jgi:hypothetical protein